MNRAELTTDDLLFVSFSGKVFAVDRETGAIIWRWKSPKAGGSPVMLLPDGDRVFVSVQGYTWALDPRDGRELWYQPFDGEGTGIPMLATMRGGSGGGSAAATAAAHQAAAAAATAAAVAAGAAAAG